MSKRMRKAVSTAMALSIVLVWGPAGWSAGPKAGTTGAHRAYLEMAPGTLTGKVVYPDNRTPVAGAHVRVWSAAEEKFVQETKTNKDGVYAIESLAVGAYSVIVADRVAVEVRVTESASPERRLNVVVPRGKPFFAIEPGRAEKAPRRLAAVGGGKGTLKTVLIIGGGVATAVGVIALAGGFSGSSGHRTVVSP